MTDQNRSSDQGQPNLGGWRLSDILRDFALSWQLMRDPRVSLLLKMALTFFAILYWVSPLDLMIGPFDDTAIVILAVRLFVQMAPKDAVERALQRMGRLHRQTSSSTTPDPEVWNIWEDNQEGNTIAGEWRVVDDKDDQKRPKQ